MLPSRGGGAVRFLKWIGRIGGYLVRTVAFGWLIDAANLLKRFWAFLKAICARRDLPHPDKEIPAGCITTTHPSVHRPDPCIYSQAYLLQLGLPVTWDNPDILLRKGGVIVPEGQLSPNTLYEIEATIWNNSYDAPVAGLRVDVSFLSFGVGAASTPIATTFVDLGVKGSVHHPAKARVPWTTPATAGHYCIQVLLSWVDDANPNNNLGQNNVNVAAAASPAEFQFPLRNPFGRASRFKFTVDTYRLAEPDPCDKTPILKETRAERIRRIAAKLKEGISIPPGWDVQISPEEASLDPGQEVTVAVSITPPASFIGEQPFNLDAFADGAAAGGVTLIVTKS
jgi:hypothetical protein